MGDINVPSEEEAKGDWEMKLYKETAGYSEVFRNHTKESRL